MRPPRFHKLRKLLYTERRWRAYILRLVSEPEPRPDDAVELSRRARRRGGGPGLNRLGQLLEVVRFEIAQFTETRTRM